MATINPKQVDLTIEEEHSIATANKVDSMVGMMGDHRVEVKWDEDKQSFSFHILLSSGHSELLCFPLPPLPPSTMMNPDVDVDVEDTGDEGKHHQPTLKRKERDERGDPPQSEQNSTLKRMRIDDEETINKEEVDEEEGEGEHGTTINDVLPPEVISVILQVARHSAPKVLWVVGRMVCRLWRDLLPSAAIVSKQRLRVREKTFVSQCAQNGWIPLLHWTSSTFLSRRNKDAMKAATARYGYLDLLKELMGESTGPFGFVDALLGDYNKFAKKAAKGGHLEVLKFLGTTGCRFKTDTFYKAISKGHLEVVEWLSKKKGITEEFDESYFGEDNSCCVAARKGRLEALKWLADEGHRCDEVTCVSAAKGGHLEVLKWLKEIGCALNDGVCSVAAGEGHLEVLKWAREQQGCKWDLQSCSPVHSQWTHKNSIAFGGHLAIFIPLRMEGLSIQPQQRMLLNEAIWRC